MGEEDDEDYSPLIYRESQLRKKAEAEAAAAATSTKKKKPSVDVASTRHRGTSTRASSAAACSISSVNATHKTNASKRKQKLPVQREEQAPREVVRKKYDRKICSADGCTNIAKKGGMCNRHGAKVEYKRRSSHGCTNQAKKGGVCIKHGAKVEVNRCRSEGCTNLAQRCALGTGTGQISSYAALKDAKVIS